MKPLRTVIYTRGGAAAGAHLISRQDQRRSSTSGMAAQGVEVLSVSPDGVA